MAIKDIRNKRAFWAMIVFEVAGIAGVVSGIITKDFYGNTLPGILLIMGGIFTVRPKDWSNLIK